MCDFISLSVQCVSHSHIDKKNNPKIEILVHPLLKNKPSIVEINFKNRKKSPKPFGSFFVLFPKSKRIVILVDHSFRICPFCFLGFSAAGFRKT